MMRILLVSATGFEIEPTRQFLEKGATVNKNIFVFGSLQITVCMTGVGMVNTAFELGRLGGESFDLAINAGVAGSFGKYSVGEVLRIHSDCFSELGAEDDKAFLSLDDLGLGTQKIKLNALYRSKNTEVLPLASGITVNTVHGNDQSINSIKQRYNSDVETMEGAAFMHAANAFNWKALPLRSISNLVEKRNKDHWNMPLAIKNLNDVLQTIMHELNQ